MKKVFTGLFSLLAAFIVLTAFNSTAGAAVIFAPITGEIERLTLNDAADVYSGGVMVVGGHEVILPRNLLIDLPANRLTLQQIFAQAPAGCVANGESGLAKADRCNGSGTGGFATLSANNSSNGNVIAGDVLIEKGKEAVTGKVTYINHAEGYFRVNGITGDSATGVMIRLNDPTSRHTIQNGKGCAGGPNCSPDPRFTLDPDNYVIAFATGNPVCIPSSVSRPFVDKLGFGATTAQANPDGSGDILCPTINRQLNPANYLAPETAGDSRRFAPLLVGDSVTAEGNFETIAGVRFVSAHTMRVNKALATTNTAGQPDYLFLEEVFIEAPGFQNQRIRAMWIGFTSLAPTDVDIWSIHRDPVTNQVHELPLASVQGCDIAAGAVGSCSSQGLIGAGGNIFRIRYDVDFLLALTNPGGKYPGGARADLNPCWQLQSSPRFGALNPNICQGGISLANNFSVMSPVPHEIQARTGRKIDDVRNNPPNGTLFTLDINGNDATNGQYLFPLGMNLGGIEVAEAVEIDLNMIATPVIFEGIPWNLDRRLSPGGCLKPGGCEPDALGTFVLDPFPFSGLDPREQTNFAVAGVLAGLPTGPFSSSVFTASTLTNVRNRIFSYVDATGKANGNNTLLPYVLGTFPAAPGPIAINATPALTIFSPIAFNDTAATTTGAPVTINVLANDVPVMGTMDNTSVLTTAPANGQVTVNFDGTVAYTPNAPFSGQDTFTYTVANNLGGRSNTATVTVTVAPPPVPPTATADTATTFTGAPQIAINVIANDTPNTYPINPASVNIVSPASCGTASMPIPGNGTLFFIAPANPGTCTFSYTVSDSATPPHTSTVTTVTVTVNPVNVNPVANPDTAFATVNSTININVTANDTTTSAFNPAPVTTSGVTGGSANALANGIVAYTAPGAPGLYSFNYTVNDVNALTSNATIVAVTVVSPPTAVADSATMTGGAGTSALIDILANDTAAAPATLVPSTVTIVTAPGNGTAAVNPVDGKVTYAPNPGFTGIDTFTYNVKDSLNVVSNTATVTVTVNAPAAESMTVTGAQYIVSSDTWQVDGTSTNHGGSVEVFNSSTVGTGSLGTATVDGNGNWTFTQTGVGPAPNAQLQISVRSVPNPTAFLEGITLVVR